jgi:predicted transposase YdaD
VRFPAILNVQSDLDEAGAYTLLTLGVQAMVLTASESNETTQKQIKALRELLEKVHQEEKDSMAGLTSKQ